MKRPFFPTKWYGWLFIAFLLLFLGAALMPPFAYSGPGLSHGRVAHDLGNHHLMAKAWSKDEEEYPIKRIPPHRSYSYRLEHAHGRTAVYEITVDGKPEVWRVTETGRPNRL